VDGQAERRREEGAGNWSFQYFIGHNFPLALIHLAMSNGKTIISSGRHSSLLLYRKVRGKAKEKQRAKEQVKKNEKKEKKKILS